MHNIEGMHNYINNNYDFVVESALYPEVILRPRELMVRSGSQIVQRRNFHTEICHVTSPTVARACGSESGAPM